MVYGKAFVELKNVSATSTSAQNITQDAEDIIAYAQKNKMPLCLVGLKSSSSELGPVNMEALSIKSEAYHGVLPAIGMNVSVKNKKLTFTAIS